MRELPAGDAYHSTTVLVRSDCSHTCPLPSLWCVPVRLLPRPHSGVGVFGVLVLGTVWAEGQGGREAVWVGESAGLHRGPPLGWSERLRRWHRRLCPLLLSTVEMPSARVGVAGVAPARGDPEERGADDVPTLAGTLVRLKLLVLVLPQCCPLPLECFVPPP